MILFLLWFYDTMTIPKSHDPGRKKLSVFQSQPIRAAFSAVQVFDRT